MDEKRDYDEYLDKKDSLMWSEEDYSTMEKLTGFDTESIEQEQKKTIQIAILVIVCLLMLVVGFIIGYNFPKSAKDEQVGIAETPKIFEIEMAYTKKNNSGELYLYIVDNNNEEQPIFELSPYYFYSFNCYQNDLYVILDLHGVVGGQSGYEHSGTRKTEFWDNEYYQEQMCLLWTEIVKHYKYERFDLAETIAAYDLINEPTLDGSTTGKKQWDVLDKLYDAIREIDNDHVISIEGCWRFTNLPNPKKYDWQNVLYQYHIYNWAYNSYPNDIYFGSHWLTYRFSDYDVPKYIGEFNFFDQKDEWEKYLNEFDKRGFSWSIWSYKTISVGWWDSSWGLYVHRMNLKDEKLKLDVRTATYEEIYQVWSNQETLKTYKETGLLKEVLDKYFEKFKKQKK